jgi:hypothetical protein
LGIELSSTWFKKQLLHAIIRASLGVDGMSEKQKPNDLFDAPNTLGCQ